MKSNTVVVVALIIVLPTGCMSVPGAETAYDPVADSLRYTGEVHLRNIRQLTFGGNNAEAYWNGDDDALIFQSDWADINGQGCDQIFVMNPDGSAFESGEQYRLVSTGLGRTTCGYFLPDGRVLYSSTHAAGPACPVPPEGAPGRYTWPIHDTYDIYAANPDGSNLQLLIGGQGYDAEATVSPDGRFVVFTSTRSGDLDLWRYELATGDLLQLTHELGYDGGAFFSGDSEQIVWRASRPEGEEAAAYAQLLARGLIEPSALQVFVAEADGSSAQQVTDLPGANWAPFFHPDGERIIFASNHESTTGGRPVFSLYMVSIDDGVMTRISHSNTFDAFPMFSHDGAKLVFSSNRNASRTSSRDTSDTNVFVADWIEHPQPVDLSFQSWDSQ